MSVRVHFPGCRFALAVSVINPNGDDDADIFQTKEKPTLSY